MLQKAVWLLTHFQQVLLLDVGTVKADVVAHHQPLFPLTLVRSHRVGAGLQRDEVGEDQLAGPGVALLNQALAAPGVPGSGGIQTLMLYTLCSVLSDPGPVPILLLPLDLSPNPRFFTLALRIPTKG